MEIETTTTQTALDLLGPPRPGICVLHGESGSGKSMVLFAYAYHMLQETDRNVFWLDLEGSMFGEKLGGQANYFYMNAIGYDADQILATIRQIPADSTVIFDGMGQMAVMQSLLEGRQFGVRSDIQTALLQKIRRLDNVPRQILMSWTTRRLTAPGMVSGVSSGVRFEADAVIEIV